jgi:hypothetical protein
MSYRGRNNVICCLGQKAFQWREDSATLVPRNQFMATWTLSGSPLARNWHRLKIGNSYDSRSLIFGKVFYVRGHFQLNRPTSPPSRPIRSTDRTSIFDMRWRFWSAYMIGSEPTELWTDQRKPTTVSRLRRGGVSVCGSTSSIVTGQHACCAFTEPHRFARRLARPHI